MENDPLVRENLDEIDAEDAPLLGSTDDDDGWDEVETEGEQDEDEEPV